MDNKKEKTEFELIKDLLMNWLKHWYYFIISLVICGLIGFVYMKLKTPEFSIESKVLLRPEDGNTGLSGMSMMKSLGFGKSSPGSNVEDEADMMASQGPLKKLIVDLKLNNSYILFKYAGLKKMDLYNQTPIEISYPEGLSDTLNAIISAKVSVDGNGTKIEMKANKEKLGKYTFNNFPAVVKTPYGEFTFNKTPNFSNFGGSFTLGVVILGYNLQTELYKGILEVEAVKKSSDLITLKMVDSNIPRAKDILHGIVEMHNREAAKEKNLVGTQTINFVTDRLAEVTRELELIDANVQSFKEKHKLTDLEADATAYLAQATELMPKKIESETQLEAIQLVDKYLSDPQNEYKPIPLISLSTGSDELMKAVNVYNEELGKRNEILLSDKKASPITKSISSQLKASRENLLFALQNTKKSIQIMARNVNEKQNELIGRMKDVPAIEKEYIALKRQQEVKQAVYIYLQQKKEETSVTSIAVMPKLRVIDEPYALSKPVSPNRMKIILMIVFFGGVLIPISITQIEPFLMEAWKRRKQ